MNDVAQLEIEQYFIATIKCHIKLRFPWFLASSSERGPEREEALDRIAKSLAYVTVRSIVGIFQEPDTRSKGKDLAGFMSTTNASEREVLSSLRQLFNEELLDLLLDDLTPNNARSVIKPIVSSLTTFARFSIPAIISRVDPA